MTYIFKHPVYTQNREIVVGQKGDLTTTIFNRMVRLGMPKEEYTAMVINEHLTERKETE